MPNGMTLTQAAFDSSYGAAGATIGVGKMSPEASDQFIDYLWRLTSLWDGARLIKMGAPQRRINKIGMGTRILRPGSSGVAQTTFARASTSELLLNVQEMIATIKVNDDELEDNIEGGDLTAHVMQLVAKQVANELEYAALMGQKTGLVGSPMLIDHQVDGWLYQTVQNGHVIDGATLGDGAAGANTRFYTKAKLSKASKAIPSKYKTQQIDFRHFVSPNYYTDFTDSLANRATPFGDVAFGSQGYEKNLPEGNRSRLGYAGYPLHTVPLIPESRFYDKQSSQYSDVVASGGAAGTNSVVVTTATTGLAVGDAILVGNPALPMAETAIVTAINAGTKTVTFTVQNSPDGNLFYNHAGDAIKNGTADGTFTLTTYIQNFVVGILRDVRIEPTRWGPERATYFTTTLRCDVQLENPDACSVVKNQSIA